MTERESAGGLMPSGDTTGAADTAAIQAALDEAERRSMDNPVFAALERQRRGDTGFVQWFFDRGEPIPPGEYQIWGDLRVPADYPFGLIQPGVALRGAGTSRPTIAFKGKQA